MKPRVSILILNWNGWRDTIDCLASLDKLKHLEYEYDIIVIDNGSTDNSLDHIIKYVTSSNALMYKKSIFLIRYSKGKFLGRFDYKKYNELSPTERIILIKNQKNYGFAGGNNVGIKFVLTFLNSDYILLLNNDTIVHQSFLSELIKISEKNKKIALLGPKIFFHNPSGKHNTIWFNGGKITWLYYPGYHRIQKDLTYDKTKIKAAWPTEWITGACFLIKVKETKKVNLVYLNDEYFFGCEDVEFSLKLRKYGYYAVIVPSSIIWHKVGRARNKAKKTYRYVSTFFTNLRFVRNNTPRYIFFFLWILYFLEFSLIFLINLFRK